MSKFTSNFLISVQVSQQTTLFSYYKMYGIWNTLNKMTNKHLTIDAWDVFYGSFFSLSLSKQLVWLTTRQKRKSMCFYGMMCVCVCLVYFFIGYEMAWIKWNNPVLLNWNETIFFCAIGHHVCVRIFFLLSFNIQTTVKFVHTSHTP